MSAEEIDRLKLIELVCEKRLKVSQAANLMGISPRQVHRIIKRYKDKGPEGITSQKRGRPSNRAYPLEFRTLVHTRNLIQTGLKLIIFIIAAIVCLNVLGIDMTSLTLFSGAIGIGLGFGLQKITSNFISGLILLLEKSMEEGDLVELAVGEMGIVRKMGARYTLIETFDSKEIMIPNEDFITNRVINWTFTNKQGRVEILLGVSYDSDIEKAKQLIIEAAKAHPRSSKHPVPQCYITQFADSSVNFLLYFWVDDVTLGRLEAKSDVYLSIWKSFKANGITIPFPQNDIYIKNWKDAQ